MYFKYDLKTLPNVRYIGQVTYKQPWSHFDRCINEFILYIMVSGDMYIKEADNCFHLTAGDFLLLEPNKNHIGYKPATCSYYFVHFSHSQLYETFINECELIKLLLEKRKLSFSSDYLSTDVDKTQEIYIPKKFSYSNPPLLSKIFSKLTSSISDYNSLLEHYKLQCSLKLSEILLLTSRELLNQKTTLVQQNNSKSEILTHRILNYINREYSSKITSSILEKEFELNYDYMNRVFKKHTGYTINNFVNVVRINKAKEILSTTSCKVYEAGYLVGIDNPYYFSRLFKKISGESPVKYIKQIMS